MTALARVSATALAAMAAVLVAALVFGSWSARVGALCAAAGLAVGLYGLVKGRRVEHGDDVDAPSNLRLFAEAIGGDGGPIIAGLSVYLIGLFARGAIVGEDTATGGWPAAVLGGLIAVGTLLFLFGAVNRVRRSEGVERQLLVEATSVAFLITMGAAFAYATLESFAGAPTISAWNTWMVGMLSWAITAGLMLRRSRS